LKGKPEQNRNEYLTANQMRLPPEQQAIRAKRFHPSGHRAIIKLDELDPTLLTENQVGQLEQTEGKP